MHEFSIPLGRLVHENLSILMCFAYSQKPLADMVESKFDGEWKYLRKALFEISAERAEKACLELALFLRMLGKRHAKRHGIEGGVVDVAGVGSDIYESGS